MVRRDSLRENRVSDAEDAGRNLIRVRHRRAIVLTEFRIFDRPAPLERPVSMADEIAVSHADDFIAFLFTALDYTAPGKNRYAYKLEGFDRDWIQAGNRRYAAYTGLSGGEYVFRVKGTNSDGVWKEAGTFVRLIVRPPFWATWWFVSLLAAAAGLARLRVVPVPRPAARRDGTAAHPAGFGLARRARVEPHDRHRAMAGRGARGAG